MSKKRDARAEMLFCLFNLVFFWRSRCRRRLVILIVSLRNRTAGRRGRQNVCVWQTWQGYNLHVMSWSSLSINVFWFLQKDLFKGKWWLAKSYFKQNYCHACHTRFAVFFPLPSCCVSSLMSLQLPVQDVKFSCLVPTVHVPSGQDWHCKAPSLGLYVPSGHKRQSSSSLS